MKRVFLALLLLVLESGSAIGQASARPDSLDAIVREFIRARNIPGAAIAVLQHGHTVKTAGYGIANLEMNVGVSAHSVFEIGSMTKQFTATAVMMLVDSGRLSLEDSLTQFIPDLPDAWHGIRLRHLLRHTSGLHDWEGDSAFSFRRQYSLREFVSFVARHPLDFEPGRRFSYTNSAYPLLGAVVERVSGVRYERFVEDRIFKPAGMVESRFRREGEIVPRRASGFVERNGVLMHGEPLRPSILAPNGLILSTAADMQRWMLAQRNNSLLRSATAELMVTPTQFNDSTIFKGGGVAWFFTTSDGRRAMVHNGSTVAGFSSVIYRYPDDDLSIVVLLNIDRGDAVNVLATAIARYCLNRRVQR